MAVVRGERRERRERRGKRREAEARVSFIAECTVSVVCSYASSSFLQLFL